MRLVSAIACLVFATGTFAQKQPVPLSLAPTLAFEPLPEAGRGARYIARGSEATLLIQPDGFTLIRAGVETPVDVRLVGASDAAGLDGLEQRSSRSHYLTGNNRAEWRVGVPHFDRVRVTDVYPGVDVEYYSDPKGLEFDFILDAGADPSRIRMRFSGLDGLEIDEDGALSLQVGSGRIRQLVPSIFQQVGGDKQEIKGSYVVHEDGQVGFAMGEHDATLPLLIDPVLDWATFLGGSGNEQVQAAAIDAEGFVYVGGFTTGPADFPLANALPGEQDATVEGFIAKLSPDGTELLFSTFIGGSLREQVNGIGLDGQGNIYVTGQTESANFPVTGGAYQSTLLGTVDAFVAKLSPDGSNLLYATYLGGPDAEAGLKMRVDDMGNAYVLGTVNGPSFPVTPGAFQTQHGGMADAFVAKLNPAGTDLVWASYFGGTLGEIPWAIDISASGEVAMGGQTSSTLPGTLNAYQRNPAGLSDGFVAVFRADGSAVDYFTYVGGTRPDGVRGVAFDGEGNIWAGGGTSSMDLGTTANAPNPEFLGGSTDAFLARLPLSPLANPPEPMVTYAGDELQNYGLDFVTAPPPGGAALRPKGVDIGGFFLSISNFTPVPIIVDGQTVDGSFGRITEFSANGVAAGSIIVPFSDGVTLAVDPSGRTVIVGGPGRPGATTTPGVFQPNHGGGQGTSPTDALITVLNTPTSSGAVLGIEQQFVKYRPGELTCPLQPGDKQRIMIRVFNFGSETATDVVLEASMTGMSLRGTVYFNCANYEEGENHRAFTCRLEDLPPGKSTQIAVDVKINTGPMVENIAQARAANAGTVSDDIREAVPSKVRLDLTKELLEPSGPNPVLEPGQPVRYRVRLTNTDPEEQAMCVRLTESESSSITLTKTELETPKSGVSCRRDFCRFDTIGPGETCTVLVSGRVRPGHPVVANEIAAEADNANRVSAKVVTPTNEGGAPIPETVKAICEPGCQESADGSGIEEVIKLLPEVASGQSTGAGSCLPAGVPFLNAGAHDLKLTPARIGFGCWLRDQPSKAALPVNLTASFNAGITNARNADGTLAGAALALDNSADSLQIPVRLGGDNRTITVNGFSADVVNHSLGATLVGLEFDSRDMFASKGVSPSALLADLLLQVDTTEVEMAGTTLPLVPRNETAMGIRAETDGDAIKLIVSLSEGFPRAWRRDGTRLVTRISGLPPGSSPDPLSNCLQSTPDDPLFDPIDLLRVEGADANGAGGAHVTNCGQTFTPQADGNGGLTIVWEFSDRQVSTLPDTGRLIEWESRWPGLNPSANLTIEAGLGPYASPGQDPATVSTPLFDPPEPLQVSLAGLLNRVPLLNEGGVANAASLAIAGTGLNAIYGLELADAVAQASTIPLPTDLAGVQVLVAAVPGGASALTPQEKPTGPPRADQFGGLFAPLLFVQPTQINFQLPWELDLSSGFVDVTVIRGGQASQPMRVPVNPFSPGIFTLDFGPGRAIVTNLDNTLAQAVGSTDDYNLPARPARIGEFIVILATGLGPVNPPAFTGDNSLDQDGTFIQRDTIQLPKVFIGGVEAVVSFAGLSPQFVGVYQLNVLVQPGTPVGPNVPITIEIGGVSSRGDVTIAVAP